MLVATLQNVFLPMTICICPDDNKYFSNRQYVFVQIGKCISSQEAKALQQAGGGNVEGGKGNEE